MFYGSVLTIGKITVYVGNIILLVNWLNPKCDVSKLLNNICSNLSIMMKIIFNKAICNNFFYFLP